MNSGNHQATEAASVGPTSAEGVLVVIGAHHDDVELRVAGTIARYLKAGWRVEAVVATTTPHISEKSPLYETDKPLTTAEVTALRESECLAAAKILGLETMHFWRYRSLYWYHSGTYNRQVADGIEVTGETLDQRMREIQGQEYILTAHRVDAAVERVAAILQQWGADLVITHTCDDCHWEHFATSMLVAHAVRLLRQRGSKVRLLGWEPGSMRGLHNYFLPTRYIDISPWIDIKCEAVRQFHSQFRDLELVARTIRKRAAHYGRLFGVDYAEPFVELDGTRETFDTDVWIPDWYDPSIAHELTPDGVAVR